MYFPERVIIRDVMLRDGLQMENTLLTTEQKYLLASRLIHAQITSIEFGSFVHRKLVPQMANTGELYERLKDFQALNLIALVPNLKGAKIAQTFGLAQINFVFSASNTHNLQNVRKTTEESLVNVEQIKAYCVEHHIKLDVSIATAFGCPFEGRISVERLQSILEKLIAIEPNIITLADTTGVANPKQVYELMKVLCNMYPETVFNLHFHDTRGMGLANIVAGMQAGVNRFDTALGGIGGCPFAPGSTGNVSTEDVVHMLHSMDIDTGINLDDLITTSSILKDLLGHELSSNVVKAGKYNRKYPIPSNN